MASTEIAMRLEKAKEADDGDENKERGNWTGKLDFLLSCLGYAVGLGNVWRFPYLCYRNGGGAFFIPYCIMLGIVGIPIFLMELSLGQFTSAGPFTCWNFAPLFTGVGFGMFVVSALVSIYYNMIIGWAFYYLFASFTDELPWSKCGDWSTNLCYDNVLILNTSYESCTFNRKGAKWFADEAKGVCFVDNETQSSEGVRAFLDIKKANAAGFKRVLPTQEYFDYYSVGSGLSDGLGDLGPIRWQLLLCYLLAFVFVCLSLSKSIKSSGKVVYFTATFPYLVLVILFIRGLMLDGMEEGIKFYITPKLEKLSDAGVWKDAAVQIFFSLSASWGGLIALASYNRFHNDCVRDALIVAFGNCLTSVFAGFVIFSYLGYLSHLLNVDVSEVAKSGPSLTFVVFPYAVTLMPLPPLWAIIFFIMLITLGVDSEFVLVETVITSLMDKFPKLRDYKFFTVMAICVVFFLLGLTMTTNGGLYMLDVMDTYSGGWNILVIAICECVSLGYCYGVFRFLDDIELMVGHAFCGCIPWVVLKYWWVCCWCFLTPIGCAFIMVFSWVDYQGMSGDKFPVWSDVLGWLMLLTVLVCIFGTALYMIITTPGSFGTVMKKLTNPTADWGPALVEHRREAEFYTRQYKNGSNFEVDPWGQEGPVVSPYDINLQEKGGIDNDAFDVVKTQL